VVRSGGDHAELGNTDKDDDIEARLEVTKEWALEARVDSASFANEASFRRGYSAGWAGRSNAEDDADYAAGYDWPK
jgi:hypothetical protein